MTKKAKIRPPKLPQLLDRKIYKTGQTRGADDDVIYQNRVSMSSTVLIPYNLWDNVSAPPNGEDKFENGFIALLTPDDFFKSRNIEKELITRNLEIGQNALVFYQKRIDWEAYDPEKLDWTPANNRTSPLGGQYVARIAATTAYENGDKISKGFNTTGRKGAGIRLFEYASKKMIADCRIQLEAIFWLCYDALEIVTDFGMNLQGAALRKKFCFNKAEELGLLNRKKLKEVRMTNSQGQTICPLCLEPLSGLGFFKRMTQAEGREVHDLTITEINLFHIDELRYGVYNHRPYNLGWGHHHCNVVVKDSGLDETLQWMDAVVKKNIKHGYFMP